jgi:hypothetical protein
MVVALKNALIIVFAFTLYELFTDLKQHWHSKYPNSVDLHVHYAQLLHLMTVFMADFAIGCIIYYIFHIRLH